jgi:hypothetical protein
MLKYVVIGMGIGCLTFVAIFPVLGYLYEPVPIRWLNSPFPTNDPVRPDEALSTVVERCNDSGQVLTAAVARRLVNEDSGQTLSLTPGANIIDPGCTTITGGIGLPQGVPPGRYHVEQIVSVEGHWHTFQIPLRTQTFTVLPGEP